MSAELTPITSRDQDCGVIAHLRELFALEPEVDIETMINDALNRKRESNERSK